MSSTGPASHNTDAQIVNLLQIRPVPSLLSRPPSCGAANEEAAYSEDRVSEQACVLCGQSATGGGVSSAAKRAWLPECVLTLTEEVEERR